MIEVKKEHFVLDRAHLEQAVLEQASLYDMYASEFARQQNVVDRLKNSLAYETAQTKIAIRANAAATKTKMTQDEVDCQVETDKKLANMRLSVLDAEEYLGQLKAAVEAMRHRRDSIENERALVLSKFSMLMDGDCSDETKAEARTTLTEQAIYRSMNK